MCGGKNWGYLLPHVNMWEKKYSIKQSLLSISVHAHTFTDTCILAGMQDFLSKIAFCQRAYLSGEMSVKIKCQGVNNLLLSAYR